MDGGMGHELRRRGVEVKGAIGSVERFLGVAIANTESPQIVKDAHRAFIDAGAGVIITNNYACIPRVIGDNVVPHIQAAGKVAREAIAGTNAIVAGSLPPLNASYRHDLVGAEEEMAKDYKTIAEAIAPFSDVLVCETMSKACEAAAAYRAGLATGKPVWVSWSLSEKPNGTLLSGETVEDAVAALGAEALVAAGSGGLQACLFNCSQVEAVDVALPRLRAVLPPHIRIGAYANGFQTVSAPPPPLPVETPDSPHRQGVKMIQGAPTEYRVDLTPKKYAEAAMHWAQDCGATIIGGCCGIFPDHIAAVAEAFATPAMK